jgi:hypothetical protein
MLPQSPKAGFICAASKPKPKIVIAASQKAQKSECVDGFVTPQLYKEVIESFMSLPTASYLRYSPNLDLFLPYLLSITHANFKSKIAWSKI